MPQTMPATATTTKPDMSHTHQLLPAFPDDSSGVAVGVVVGVGVGVSVGVGVGVSVGVGVGVSVGVGVRVGVGVGVGVGVSVGVGVGFTTARLCRPAAAMATTSVSPFT